MDAPVCFSFDPETGLYLGSTEADASPLEEGVWLDPGHTTREPPPAPGAKQAVVRQGDAWVLVPDHRGETWYRDGIAVIVPAVGDPIAMGLSKDAPSPVVEVPTSASRLGLARALKEVGKWQSAKAAIASDPDAQEEWDLAIEIRRTDPLTAGIIQALGLTSADVDQLLIRAAALTA